MNRMMLNKVARYNIGGQLYIANKVYVVKPNTAAKLRKMEDLTGEPLFIDMDKVEKVEEVEVVEVKEPEEDKPKTRGRPKTKPESEEISNAVKV